MDAIASSLQRLGHPCVALLRPPLSRDARNGLWKRLPFAPTQELDELYEWRDGTEAPAGALLDNLHIIPGFFLMSLNEAVDVYFERASGPQWQSNWFPFLADGAGDFYVVPCLPSSIPAAGVVGFIHGEPEQPVEYESIETMMRTFAEAYVAGAVILDEDGCLEYDDEAFRLIAQRNNPGQTIWHV